ncbi:MAG TPA: serine/threonine-protein kinase [Gemmatimonadaceae bacterium]|nr:serine/threonine-protein kinase [Gemmatimonadaceae bacterium]
MAIESIERWRRTDAVFSAALEREPDEREAFVRTTCEGDDALRHDVMALLATAATDDSTLDGDAASFAAPLVRAMAAEPHHDADDLAPGARIGAYRITRELARGGMGAVYLAERDDDEFRKAVALKVVKRGIDTDEVLQRFRAERQILAGFAHPNIASLLDGGATGDGRPYLVMEYVAGQPITVYCDTRRLTIDQRLVLFETVCAAVQHAHQNLVIHRDVKPSNVLVSDEGVVKLLDFGVAKLLTDDDTAPHTRAGTRLLTPEYASPEQLRGDTVTTASDVYSLGVLLYELLTGTRPSSGTTNGDAASGDSKAREARRPSAAWSHPSRRANGDDRGIDAAAAARTTTPERMRRRLHGDLDTIVLKALAPEPERRYRSAEQLREDLERHRSGLPVRARPDTARYRLEKFVRRHRAGVAAALLVAILILTSTIALAVQQAATARERDRATLEAAKASEVRDFLVGLFTSSQPNRQLGDTLTVGEVLEFGAARADSLSDQPQLRALLLVTIGDVYRVLGRYDRAEPLLTRAVAEYEAIPDAPPLDRAGALTSIANLHFDLRRYEEAAAPTRAALEIQRRELGPSHPDVLTSLGNLATLTARAGDLDSALALHAQVLALRRELGPDEPSIAVTLNNMGSILLNAGRHAEAEPYLREALEVNRRLLPREHPDVALAMSNLATLYREQGRYDEAEPLYREALALRRSVLGPWHPRLGISHYQIARLHALRGLLDSAELHFRATLEIDRRVYGDDHPEIAVDATQLARVLLDRGDPLAAEPLLREALAIRVAHGGESQPTVADALALLATAMEAQGEKVEAERLLERALAVSRASRGDEDAATKALANRLAMLRFSGSAPARSIGAP